MGEGATFAGDIGKGGEGAGHPKDSCPNQASSLKEGGATFAGDGAKDIEAGSTDVSQHDPTKDANRSNGGKGDIRFAGDVEKGL